MEARAPICQMVTVGCATLHADRHSVCTSRTARGPTCQPGAASGCASQAPGTEGRREVRVRRSPAKCVHASQTCLLTLLPVCGMRCRGAQSVLQKGSSALSCAQLIGPDGPDGSGEGCRCIFTLLTSGAVQCQSQHPLQPPFPSPLTHRLAHSCSAPARPPPVRCRRPGSCP